MRLDQPGMMVANEWQELSGEFPGVRTDACVVMPNHVHGIILLVGAPLVGALDDHIRATTRVAPTLGQVIGAFKSITTNEYINGVKTCGWTPFSGTVWQRNYYEHVVRNHGTLNAIRDYIESNPAQWENDPENPEFTR